LAQSKREAFFIVGIGASAGGLEAFTELLKHLPADSGLGFVLVQHLDPTHESALTEILGRVTAMPVREVANDQAILPNHVYVIPPNASLSIQQGVLALQPRQQTGGAQRSIDHFFQSLAEDQHERAIGVVLSGTASDGTVGLEAIKAEGGLTFVQDSESAKYDSMPQSAAAADCVDFVLSPANIARELVRVAKHPYLASVGTNPVGDDPNALTKILLLLRRSFGVDFSLYKPSTIQRRLARRMVLNKLNNLDAYAGFLQGNAIPVERFFPLHNRIPQMPETSRGAGPRRVSQPPTGTTLLRPVLPFFGDVDKNRENQRAHQNKVNEGRLFYWHPSIGSLPTPGTVSLKPAVT
jgi:two-component system CheB/CheR fusion protein